MTQTDKFPEDVAVIEQAIGLTPSPHANPVVDPDFGRDHSRKLGIAEAYLAHIITLATEPCWGPTSKADALAEIAKLAKQALVKTGCRTWRTP
jgi:hypothetical protein